MREEIRHIDLSDRSVRHFGWLMGVVAGIVASLILWKNGWAITPAVLYVIGVGAGLAVISTILPRLIRPIYRLWMMLAVVLGFVMTRVILSVVFAALVTPIGLVMRLLGKDPLKKKPDSSADTYWIEREAGDPADERMRRYY